MDPDESANKPTELGVEAIDDEALETVTGGKIVKPVNTTLT